MLTKEVPVGGGQLRQRHDPAVVALTMGLALDVIGGAHRDTLRPMRLKAVQLRKSGGSVCTAFAVFREGYSWHRDPQPRLEITGQRVDCPATSNGWTNDAEHPFIVSVINLLRLGSWKITGRYEDATLRFVVWVTE